MVLNVNQPPPDYDEERDTIPDHKPPYPGGYKSHQPTHFVQRPEGRLGIMYAACGKLVTPGTKTTSDTKQVTCAACRLTLRG